MPPRKRKATEDPYTTCGYPYLSGTTYGTATAGSSVNPIALDSPPKAKRQRKAKDPDAPVPEKRGAIHKKQCPKNIIERVERVMAQRFYMIDRKREGNELREEFSVLGSTGNVYTVVIDKKPSCNCPDALKGNHCKHILFIFLKVLQVSQNSGHWYQKALITSELEDIFTKAPRAPAAIAHERIRNAYAQATGKKVAPSSEASSRKRLPGEEDDCPICYENMHREAESKLTFCEDCGNGLHKVCFQQWANAAKNGITCVFCRAKWPESAPAGSSKGAGARSSEGYLNLGSLAGVSTVRDTSSYYQGPTRGKRFYGYRDYF
ncbi:hypothetical protein L226DRAFT_550337 [Lentinus tigrinus ALCF2SS1-7]|uniref:SWIM-type domain-containing protein n=1 Tax=Lentinus tigrinus ALCF2SS1-6 TaxID=1328759 RepID=A0A5C2SR53_9APHY|nr:hypothetical protein L227DRAFT_649086 [Lentinus tigrinus ALCF2SS1-6]RPD80277.1 hypothetical protein L226DRAFT_550337 [Lentinus tigrinus ALCF2SS1-7]